MRFESCASSYDAHAGPQKAFAAKVAGFIAAPPGMQVVELGAGTGALTRHLCVGLGLKVRASDASPAMVELGRKAVSEARWSVIDAFTGEIPAAELQVSSGLVQWCREPLIVIPRWKAALTRGGKMVHAFPCEPCLREWREIVPHSPVAWRTPSEWGALFEASGLTVTRTEVWEEVSVVPSALELVRSFHYSGVTGRAQMGPGELRAAIRVYAARHASGSGVAATWAWMALEARARE